MKGCEGEKGGAYQMSFFAMPLLCEDVIVRDIFRCKGRLICTVQRCYQGECLDSFTVEKLSSGRCFYSAKPNPTARYRRFQREPDDFTCSDLDDILSHRFHNGRRLRRFVMMCCLSQFKACIGFPLTLFQLLRKRANFTSFPGHLCGPAVVRGEGKSAIASVVKRESLFFSLSRLPCSWFCSGEGADSWLSPDAWERTPKGEKKRG
jgi:hypothetical protein